MLAKARRLCYDKYRFYQKGRIEYATFFPYKGTCFLIFSAFSFAWMNAFVRLAGRFILYSEELLPQPHCPAGRLDHAVQGTAAPAL